MSFNFPLDWSLVDKSDAQNQYLVLSLANASSFIEIIAPRTVISSYDQVTAIRRDANRALHSGSRQKDGY